MTEEEFWTAKVPWHKFPERTKPIPTIRPQLEKISRLFKRPTHFSIRFITKDEQETKTS